MKIILLLILALPISAANTDDEIIKNLDFFQNMELMKDENPFASVTFSKSVSEQSTIKNKESSEKSNAGMEKKQ